MTEETVRVLVVDDDVDQTEYLRLILQRQPDITVSVANDAPGALALLREATFDVVVTDIEMPGMSGLAMLPEVRKSAPGVPVIVITAHGNVSYAVEALRREADEFLVKPVDSAQLTARIHELAEKARSRSAGPHDVVLAVGAHPDDVEIGIGATLAGHHEAGDPITVLTLSGGGVGGAVDERRREAQAAADVVGARLDLRDFPDTRLDPAAGVTTAIEEVIAEIRPTVVYSHSVHDRHQDHRAVAHAVEIATRRIPVVAAFQSPSATLDYRPTRFIPVDGRVETKLRMLAAFASQQHRDYMDPDLVRASARYWSRYGEGNYCEPVEMVRAAVPLTAWALPQAVAQAPFHDPAGGRA
ncbi:response regulator [Nocardioides insulae]|uniref:response regulator n=1 Tax=Nocardioides insulae TaxID=394734 RepID=UPI00042105CB|nr:response regulator [Nocardioides insulae]